MTSDAQIFRTGRILRMMLGVYLVVLVLAVSPYTPSPAQDIKNLVTSWAAVSGIGVLLFGRFVLKEELVFPRVTGQLFGALLVVLLIASLHAPNFGLAMFVWRQFFALFVLLLCAKHAYRTPAQVAHLLLALCLAMALATLYAFAQRHGLDPLPWHVDPSKSSAYDEVPSTFGNPNYAAHVLVLSLTAALGLMSLPGWRWCVVFLPLFVAHLHWTGQRGGLIAIAVALAFVAIATLTNRHERIGARLLFTVWFTGLAVLGLAMGGMLYLQATTGRPYPLDASLLVRYNSYLSASRMALAHPLLGFGAGAYAIENVRYWTPYEQGLFAGSGILNKNVHNDLLEFAVDAGLPAAALYLTLLVHAITKGLLLSFVGSDASHRRIGRVFAAVFLVFLVDGLFGFNMRVPTAAAVCALLLGALEGVGGGLSPCAPSAASRRRTTLFYVVCGLIAVGSVWASTRHFAALVYHRFGASALAYRVLDAAEEYLRRSEGLSPWYWDTPRQRAQASAYRKDTAEVVRHLERSLEARPYFVPTLAQLALEELNLYVSRSERQPAGRSQESIETGLAAAERYAREAIDLCPAYGPAHEALGRIASVRATERQAIEGAAPDRAAILGLWAEAERCLDRAVRDGVTSPAEVQELLAVAQASQENYAEAEATLLRVLTIAPERERAWELFDQLAARTARYETLARLLEERRLRLLERTPEDTAQLAALYRRLAQVEAVWLKDLEAADAHFREAIRVAPGALDAWIAYTDFAIRNGRFPAWRAFLVETSSRATATNPLPAAVALVGQVYRDPAWPLEAAIAALSDSLGSDGSESLEAAQQAAGVWAAQLLGMEIQRRNETPALRARAELRLGMVYSRLERFDTAREYLRAAGPHLSPDLQVICWVHEAHTLVGLGQPGAAAPLLERALAQQGKSLDLLVMLARALAASGEVDRARLAYAEALAMPGLDPKVERLLLSEQGQLAQ